MKAKKAKIIRKGIAQYTSSFGFREPYQVLVDAEFLQQSLKFRLNIKTSLAEILNGQVKPMITTCVIQDLRNLGDDYSGAVVAAKRFERRRCTHKQAIPGSKCYTEIIGSENTHRYCIASQDKELNKLMKTIPGVPFFYLNNDSIVLAPLSSASQEKISQLAKEKMMPSVEELKRLKKVTGIDSLADKTPELPLHRRKVAKAPNPLSLKKKSKGDTNNAPRGTNGPNFIHSSSSNNPNLNSKSVEKTKRKRKRNKSKSNKVTEQPPTAVASDVDS